MANSKPVKWPLPPPPPPPTHPLFPLYFYSPKLSTPLASEVPFAECSATVRNKFSTVYSTKLWPSILVGLPRRNVDIKHNNKFRPDKPTLCCENPPHTSWGNPPCSGAKIDHHQHLIVCFPPNSAES